MKRDYELAYILNPEVNEEEVRAIQDRIEQIVANYGGQVVKVNQWGRRRLAYPIERHRDGLYTFIDMILTPETVAELERMLKVSEIVLRHMVKRRDPKAAQKEREEREEREARAAAAAASTEETPVEAGTTIEQAPEEAAPVEDVPVLTEAEAENVPSAIVEESVEA